MVFTLRQIDEGSAREILGWRYEAPYDFYNVGTSEIDEIVQALLDPDYAYYILFDEHKTIVAFCCFGADARVPGGDYRATAVDVGWGLRPDLTGRGFGLPMVEAILDHGRMLYAPVAFRTTVVAWNTRSLRVCEKAGFTPIQTFTHPAPWNERSRTWVMMLRPEASAGIGTNIHKADREQQGT